MNFTKIALINSLIKENPSLQQLDSGRVKCSITGHEMCQEPEVISNYLKSRRYLRQKEVVEVLKTYSEHFQQDSRSQLYICKLTNRSVSADSLCNHVNGKKFRRALQQYATYQASCDQKNDIVNANAATIGDDDALNSVEMLSDCSADDAIETQQNKVVANNRKRNCAQNADEYDQVKKFKTIKKWQKR